MSAPDDEPTDPTTASRAPLVIAVPRPGRTFVVALTAVLLLVMASGVAFYVGQSTRKSAEQVARETVHAVNAAVAAKGVDDKKKRLKIMHREATRMNARHRAAVRKLQRTAANRAANAYSSGSSAGRQQGYSAGVDDGVTKASDELTCSDDSDVALPYCHTPGY